LKYDPPTTPARTTRGSPSPTTVKGTTEKSPKSLSVVALALKSGSRDRERHVVGAEPRRALPDIDEAILVAVGQRPQQDAADDAEDGGVGADAQRERDDDGRRNTFRAQERSEGEAQVGHDGHILLCFLSLTRLAAFL
jgi:hypothetical protein